MKKILSLFLALVMTVTCLAGISFAADPIAKIVTGDKTVEATTLEELAAAISPRGTSVVTLLQDITAGAVTNIPVCTIDLNGKTWKTTAGNVLAIQDEKTDDDADNFYTVIKNGTLHGATTAIRHEVGGLKVVDCTLQGDGSSAIQILDVSNSGKFNDGNIVENSTLICTVKIGAIAFNKKNLDMSRIQYTIRNSSIINTVGEGYAALSRASGTTSGTFVLEEGTKLYSYKADAIGADVRIAGKALVKDGEKQQVEALGKSYSGLNMWTASGAETPAEPVAPVEPEKPAEPVAPPTTDSGEPVVKWWASEADFAAAGKSVEFTSLSAAIKHVNEQKGGYLQLQRDMIAEEAYYIDVGCTIDFNGKTITGNIVKGGEYVSNTMFRCFDSSAATAAFDSYSDTQKTMVFKNGTILSYINETKYGYAVRLMMGYLHMSDMVIHCGANTINYYSATPATETLYSYIENCYILTNNGALIQANQDQSQSKLVLRDNVLALKTSGQFANSYQNAGKLTITMEGENKIYRKEKKLTNNTEMMSIVSSGAEMGWTTEAKEYTFEGYQSTATGNASTTLPEKVYCYTIAKEGETDPSTVTQPTNDAEENVTYTPANGGQATKTTLKKAMDLVNANGGGTITLLADITAGNNGNVNGSQCAVVFTTGAVLDLGGHTLTSTVYNVVGINAPGQTVTVKNGTLFQNREGFNIRLVKGYLEMADVTGFALKGSNVAIYSDEKAKSSSITNCTLVSEGWYSVMYRPETASGILQKDMNIVVKGCTVISTADFIFAAHQAENKITVEGENHFYVSGKQHWICNAAEVPCCQVILNAAMTMENDQASVEVTVAGEKKSYKNLKYFKVEPLAAGIDLSKPEATYGKDLEIVQKALVETAYGFFNKANYTVYSSDRLSRYANGINDQILSSTYMTPEDLASDNIYYFNCGRILHNIYAEALEGYDLGGSARNVMTNAMLCAQSVDSPIVIDKWTDDGLTKDQADASRKAWVQNWYDNFDKLQAGDLVVLLQEGGNYSSGSAGHLMMYLGQREGVEGGVLLSNTTPITNVRENMFNPANAQTGTWNLYKPDNTVDSGGTVLGDIQELAILRPLNDPYLLNAYRNGGVDAVLTKSAKIRTGYEGIELMLTSEKLSAYSSVEPGKSYTVKLEITNNSDQTAWDAEHALYLNGEKLKEAGKVNLVGKAQVKGEATNYAGIEYTFTVPADAKQGDVMVISGDVNGLPTRTMSFTVSGRKLETKVTKAGSLEKPGTMGAFVNQFYQEIFGIELKLPITANGLKQELFKPVNNDYLAPKEQSKFYDMVLPDHFIGGDVILHHPAIAPHFPYANHVTKFHEDSYEVGDIFIGAKAKVERTQNPNTGVYSTKLAGYTDVAYIYLGNGKVAEASKTGYAVRPFDMLIDSLNYQADRVSGTGGQADTQWLVVLRPSLMLESLAPLPVPEAPETPAVPETPEVPAAPAAPAEKSAPVALIAGIAAAVVILAAIVVVVLKKKKK